MLIRRHDVLQLTSLSQSSLYRLMKESRFPRPVRISPRCVAWKSEEVEDIGSTTWSIHIRFAASGDRPGGRCRLDLEPRRNTTSWLWREA